MLPHRATTVGAARADPYDRCPGRPDDPGPGGKGTLVRKLMIGGLIALLAIGLAACTSSDADPAVAEAQRKADMYDIDSIEKRLHL